MTDDYPGGGLPEHLGLSVLAAGEGWIEMGLEIGPEHGRPGVAGLHAGTMVTLADTACGFGCRDALPDTATGFSTIELKTNFLGTVLEGALICRAEAEHLGRTTQIWSAKVRHIETDRVLALFRCTQLVLY